MSRADVESSTLSLPKRSATRLRNAMRLVASWIYGLGARAHRAMMARTASRRGRLACAIETRRGAAVPYRQVVFFVIFLSLALLTFQVLQVVLSA